LIKGGEGVQHSFSSLAEFGPLREEILAYLRTLCPEAAERLFVALNEAVNNALLHGTKEDGGKTVTVTVTAEADAVTMTVRHDGRGFRRRPAGCGGRTGLAEGGRGLHIIMGCADSVSYDDTGNEIVIRKTLAGRTGGSR
jgi:serine/threonine-protein kinase RsbW